MQVTVSAEPSVGAEHRRMFFRYISIADLSEAQIGNGSAGMFCFNSILQKDESLKEILLTLQLALFNAFLDKVRALPADHTKIVLRSLPPFLDIPSVMRPPVEQ